jgi:hypothetical protein
MDTIQLKLLDKLNVWQGDKVLTGNATLKHFDGYNKLLMLQLV